MGLRTAGAVGVGSARPTSSLITKEVKMRRALIAAMAATVVASVGAVAGPAAAEPHDVVVGPGDNVQAVLAAAAPGTTVKLKAGTYHQFLNPPAGVTIDGSGKGALDGTVLAWPTSGTNLCSYGV